MTDWTCVTDHLNRCSRPPSLPSKVVFIERYEGGGTFNSLQCAPYSPTLYHKTPRAFRYYEPCTRNYNVELILLKTQHHSWAKWFIFWFFFSRQWNGLLTTKTYSKQELVLSKSFGSVHDFLLRMSFYVQMVKGHMNEACIMAISNTFTNTWQHSRMDRWRFSQHLFAGGVISHSSYALMMYRSDVVPHHPWSILIWCLV